MSGSKGLSPVMEMNQRFRGARPLLACYPRDILSQLCDVACYEGRPARLEADALHWAWNNYFGAADGSAGIQNGSASVLHKGVSK